MRQSCTTHSRANITVSRILEETLSTHFTDKSLNKEPEAAEIVTGTEDPQEQVLQLCGQQHILPLLECFPDRSVLLYNLAACYGRR